MEGRGRMGLAALLGGLVLGVMFVVSLHMRVRPPAARCPSGHRDAASAAAGSVRDLRCAEALGLKMLHETEVCAQEHVGSYACGIELLCFGPL